MWRTIANYPELKIFDTGGVFNINTNQFLVQRDNNYGYLRVSWGRRKKEYVHRLVAMAFIPNPNNYPCVNHKDGNKKNNIATNLEWVTYSQNTTHAYKLGLEKKRFGGDHPLYNKLGSKSAVSKLTDEQRLMIPELVKRGISMAQIARDWGVSSGCIKKYYKKMREDNRYEQILKQSINESI